MKAVRKAAPSEAEAIHRMLADIDWISNSVKTDDGLQKIRTFCNKGEVWVVALDREVVAMMFLRLDLVSHSLSIPILTTAWRHRRNGYARLLIRQAKTEAVKIGCTVEGYPKNHQSINLLETEHFKLIQDHVDKNGNDLFRWSP